MRRKTFSAISLLISAVMLCSFAPTVGALDSSDVNEIDISQLSADTLQLIQTLGVEVDSESSIQLTPLNPDGQSRGVVENTLSITNFVGNQATTNTIMVFGDDGTVPIVKEQSLARGAVTYNYDKDAKIAVNASGVYNEYSSGGWPYTARYSQPVGLSFVYTKIVPNAQVQNIKLRYLCAGYVHTVPDLVNLNIEGAYESEISQNYPLVNTHYGKTQPYDSSRAMWVDGMLGYESGQYLYCETIVDGSVHSGSSGTQHF